MADNTQTPTAPKPIVDPAAAALAAEMGNAAVPTPESSKAANTDGTTGTVPRAPQAAPRNDDDDTDETDASFDEFVRNEFPSGDETPPGEQSESVVESATPPAVPAAQPVVAPLPPATTPAAPAAAASPPTTPTTPVEPPKPEGQPVVNLFDFVPEVPQPPKTETTPPAAVASAPGTPPASPEVPTAPTATPPADESHAQLREEYIEKHLIPLYSFNQEEARALMVEPEKVLPRVFARAHADIIAAAVSGLAQHMPRMFSAMMQQRTAQEDLTKQFFGRWQELAKPEYVPKIRETLSTYSRMHPQKPVNELVEEVGALVMLSLRVNPSHMAATPPQTPQNPPPVKPMGPAGRTVPKPGGGNAFESFAEELLAEDQVNED